MKIIAEIGSNWKTLDDCLNSISLAKACGADAVKFQAFDHAALYGFGPVPYGVSQLGMILFPEMPGQLPLDWLPKLKAKADACKIELMVSAFSVELLDEVDKYVSTHKVASAELTHKRMLERLREIGKPVILSTGASSMADIGMALDVLGDTPTTLLYCVAAYPASYIHFGKMIDIAKRFGKPVGFSDHSLDVLAIPLAAKGQGAVVIEKHCNLVGVSDTPDAPHSLSLDHFKAMCKAIRGESVPHDDQSEREMFTTHNRRLIAFKDIKAGEVLRENVNFGIFRSLMPDLRALSPWLVDAVNGKVSKVDVSSGSGIGPDAI